MKNSPEIYLWETVCTHIQPSLRDGVWVLFCLPDMNVGAIFDNPYGIIWL